ncbi:MAG TPA: protein translocase subunit SecD, partial [Dehalococcoidia bacterium]
MRQRSTQLLLALIAILTVFSILIVWPSDPKRYLPDAIPWPEPACAGPVCIGHGLNFFGTERKEMKLGLDLRGGTRLVLEADVSTSPGVNLDEALDSAVDVVERRVNAFGVAESIVERVGANRISVQLPGISSEEAVAKIGRTAQLQFMEMAKDPTTGEIIVNQADGTTKTFPLDVVLSSETFIRNAKYVPVAVVDKDGVRREINGSYLNRGDIFISSNQVGLPVLNFAMNDEGTELLKQATRRLSNPPQPLAFFLDGEPVRDKDGNIIAPRVRSEIDGKGVIEGLNRSEANTLSTLLRTGAFPVPLRVVQQDDVDATLGDQAVVYSVQAGLIAIFVVMAFMTLYYRLPGALASLALFVYVSLTLAVFKIWPVTVTSAGMAAFVLSVGMAVDANILIFERMKEELRIGRSLVGAIDAGFSRAWTSIRDANVSTLITCVILFWFGDQFGAALVKGFALNLAIGVIISLFSSVLVTRVFLLLTVGTRLGRSRSMFG